MAVRFGEGMGWEADNIVYPDSMLEDTETMAQALLRLLAEADQDCDSTEWVAVGTNEPNWRFTYRAGPPATLDAERGH